MHIKKQKEQINKNSVTFAQGSLQNDTKEPSVVPNWHVIIHNLLIYYLDQLLFTLS